MARGTAEETVPKLPVTARILTNPVVRSSAPESEKSVEGLNAICNPSGLPVRGRRSTFTPVALKAPTRSAMRGSFIDTAVPGVSPWRAAKASVGVKVD